MLFWPDHIPQSDLQMIPQLANVTVSKDYFSHTVTITVTERAPLGIWCFSAEPGAVADGGIHASSARHLRRRPAHRAIDSIIPARYSKNHSTRQGDLVSVVYDSAQSPKGLSQKVLSDEFLPNFLSIMNVLKGSGLGVSAIELRIFSLEQMDVLTAERAGIYFSLRFPADEYLPVIQKLMLQPNFDSSIHRLQNAKPAVL